MGTHADGPAVRERLGLLLIVTVLLVLAPTPTPEPQTMVKLIYTIDTDAALASCG